MTETDHSNTIFNLAADLVNHTSLPVFLTGKAGTGKTTFLRYIREHTKKRNIVVAPTGVAAINAGGVTAHAFFQLPFGPYVPAMAGYMGGNVTDRQSLFRNSRFSSARRELFEELELLIIDEISMFRADMLDAIDAILRHFRHQPSLPFGGVQVLYIGDMFQLPPVVQPQEWGILEQYYESPFFFDSKVARAAPPVYVELKTIYRQNDEAFIGILNRIRNNKLSEQDLDVLNTRYDPEFQPSREEQFITLTSHNRKADIINNAALTELPGKAFRFEAEITGEFSDNALPTDQTLQLKVGAQVMFVKNDTGEDRRFYNGKLATVKSIDKDGIVVAFNDGEELELEKETWKNIRYTYNREKDKLEEEELGSFKQFPVRLAWAITIHKSQGLTFEKAVIDAGASFAPGQVYVAISRCTSMEGLVLHSRITPGAVSTDQRIIAFAQREAADKDLEHLLTTEKSRHEFDALARQFSWKKTISLLEEWKAAIAGKKLADPETAAALINDLLRLAREQSGIAEKFQLQLLQLFEKGDHDALKDRAARAVAYFSKILAIGIIAPASKHFAELRHASKIKKYLEVVRATILALQQQLQKYAEVEYQGVRFPAFELSEAEVSLPEPLAKKRKAPKGQSKLESLELFREGKSVEEIANLRNLSSGTVEAHLGSFVLSGELDIAELVSSEKTEEILAAIDDPYITASALKAKMGDECSYGEIRAVMNYYWFLQERTVEAQRPI